MQATGLEALFGYLYLNNRKERLNQLFSVIMNDGEESDHAL
jgi:23S rRNA maturation mini-RNase III